MVATGRGGAPAVYPKPILTLEGNCFGNPSFEQTQNIKHRNLTNTMFGKIIFEDAGICATTSPIERSKVESPMGKH